MLKQAMQQTKEKKKITSWKKCYITSSTNLWNEVYRLEAGKRRDKTQITTFRKTDGSLTANLQETLKHMLEHFTLEDTKNVGTDYYKWVRVNAQEHVYWGDDNDFNVEQITNAVTSMENTRHKEKMQKQAKSIKAVFRFHPLT
jgi:hypothetical protein